MRQYIELCFMHMNPDEITSLLDIQPTESHKAGSVRVPGAVWKHDHWALRSEIDESELDAAKHFEALLDKLEPHTAAIRALAERIGATMSWVVTVFADEQTPIGVIPREIIGKIDEMGTDLNVSMYFDRKNLG
jgi:hypothetical protein